MVCVSYEIFVTINVLVNFILSEAVLVEPSCNRKQLTESLNSWNFLGGYVLPSFY